MLISNIKCSNCGAYHDATLNECPECHKSNELRTLKDFPKHVLFLHPVAQISIFLIGFAYIGMLLTELFLSYIITRIPGALDNITLAELWLEYLTYISMTLGILAVILTTRRKMFLDFFKKGDGYLFGLIFGAIIIGVSIVLSIIISAFYNGGDNENQATAASMVSNYPIPSFFILCFIGPICEELTYRVGLYSFLRRINKYLAFAVVTIVFALIHFGFTAKDMVSELVSLPAYLVLGFLLTLSYEKRGPVCSILAHIIYNSFSFLLMVIAQYGNAA